MLTEPLVSILIPVYNAGKYLRPAVESVTTQTYTNTEIVVIDDGSTDECISTITTIRDPRLRVLRQANSGKSVALNRAMELISGEFYAVHDADDVSHRQRIERQVECMLDCPDIVAVFTGYELILGERRVAPRFRAKGRDECRRDIESMRMPSHDPTAMFRVSMIKEMRYEPTLRVGQGWDYILRVGELHPMMVLGECLYSYRVHLGSNTRHDAIQRENKRREVLYRACRRRGLGIENSLGRRAVPLPWATHRQAEYGLVPHFMESVLDLRGSGRWKSSLQTALACLRLHPFDPLYYKPLVYSVVPPKLISCYRGIKRRRPCRDTDR